MPEAPWSLSRSSWVSRSWSCWSSSSANSPLSSRFEPLLLGLSVDVEVDLLKLMLSVPGPLVLDFGVESMVLVRSSAAALAVAFFWKLIKGGGTSEKLRTGGKRVAFHLLVCYL